MSTLKDVAREAGVSVTTASYALKGSKKISHETTLRVKEAAKRLNYLPSGIARGLKASKTWNIGVFLHGYSGPTYGDVLQAIHDGVSSANYEMMVCSTSVSDRLLMERHMDGAIILNSFIPDKTLERVQSPNFPVVVMDRTIELPNVSCVVADNVAGGYMAVRHLLDFGYKKLAFIIGGKESYENAARVEGIKKALYEAGIDFGAVPVAIGDFKEETGKSSMKSLLNQYPDIDAVFCLNDEMAIGAMNAIKESGRLIPQDIAVIGFDDIPLASYTTPALTTIRVDRRLWGYLAAVNLLELIDRKGSGRIVKIPVELIRRETVGKISVGIT